MPSAEIFDDRLSRIEGCQDKANVEDPVARYMAAATAAGYVDTAEPGTAEGDQELYNFLRHVFRTSEDDGELVGETRDRITSGIMLLFGYNTHNPTWPISKAYDDHMQEVRSNE